VISASTIQGIGWRGLSQEEINATNGTGVFSQRVFSQGYEVGKHGMYDFWADQHNKPTRGKPDFWFPRSPPAKYSVSKGLDANSNIVGKVVTVFTAPLMILGTKIANTAINALPPDSWKTPLTAPLLAEPFKPMSVRFGKASDAFDQGYDAPGESRDPMRERAPDDPYAGARPLPGAPRHATGVQETDAGKGDADSEASLRYEHHAMLRMQARREGRYKNDQQVNEEDDPTIASADYNAWRSRRIKEMLAASIDTHATDHSTIMTNPMHAEKALAYDVAVGLCHIQAKDLQELRVQADWRFLEGLKPSNTSAEFSEYFKSGLYQKKLVDEWASDGDGEGAMPAKILSARSLFGGGKL